MESEGPNTYDVGEAVDLTALFLVGQTVGSIAVGTAQLFVRDPSGLDLTVGAPILVAGAGYVVGDLRTTVVSAAGQQITLADQARANAFQVQVGTPTDPSTTTCTVRDPSGADTTVTPHSSLAGVWTAVFTTTMEGAHYYRFVGTGTAAGDRWRKFVVRPERVPVP